MLRARLGSGVCVAGGPAAVLRLRVGARSRSGHERVPCVQVPIRYGAVRIVDARFVERAHRQGTAVHVWTVNDPVLIAHLLDIGVDGIMSDDLDALRDVWHARGFWPPS
jgi:glycerophosphoryl diester phosphodiesterase